MKNYRIINKFRFFTTVSLIIVLLFASMFMIVVNAKSTSTEVLVPVYVSGGDSLWKLASQYYDGNSDIRGYINKVIVINNLQDSNIKPGQLIMFPQISE